MCYFYSTSSQSLVDAIAQQKNWQTTVMLVMLGLQGEQARTGVCSLIRHLAGAPQGIQSP